MRANKKGHQANALPQPQPEVTAQGEGENPEPETVTEPLPETVPNLPNPFDNLAPDMTVSPSLAVVMQESSRARQKLAEAADYAKAGEAGETAASEAAGEAIKILAKLRCSGAITAAEVTGMMGDNFGYKEKKDGTPGATPLQPGETYRKRIVRFVQGYEYVTGGEGGRFYTGLPVEEVEPIIHAVIETGDLTPWEGYKNLTDLKAEHNGDRPNPAFDPDKIDKLVEAISEDNAAAIIAASPLLIKAYQALYGVLGATATKAIAIKAAADAEAEAEAE